MLKYNLNRVNGFTFSLSNSHIPSEESIEICFSFYNYV